MHVPLAGIVQLLFAQQAFSCVCALGVDLSVVNAVNFPLHGVILWCSIFKGAGQFYTVEPLKKDISGLHLENLSRGGENRFSKKKNWGGGGRCI